MTFKNKLISIIICLFTMLIFAVPAFADTLGAEEKIAELSKPDGRIMGIASKGSRSEHPENSKEAVIKAINSGIDFTVVDVKKTSDGVLILFSDDDTERMLDCDAPMVISETDYKTLSLYNLRAGEGGKAKEATKSKIPMLSEILEIAKSHDYPLILRLDAEILPDAVAELNRNDALNSSIILMQNSRKEIENALSLCESTPYIIGTVKSNIIFKVSSFVNYLSDNSALCAELKSTNRYGVNFQKTVLKNYIQDIRLMSDTTCADEAGARKDTEKWWTDLINRGYSVIVTDYPELFTEYLERTDTARLRLQQAYDAACAANLPEFRNKLLNDYKKAYDDALNNAYLLLKDGSSSVQDMNDIYYELNKAVKDININFEALEKGTEGTTVTVPRIILCILAFISVLAVQIYFFRRRKTKEG